MIFIPVLLFCVGLIIGSFLNVVIFRLGTGRSVVTGRSRCDRCDRHLAWYELIPVFSFLGLRGKCRTCKQTLSFEHPVVELLTAIVFLFLYARVVLPLHFAWYAWVSFAVASIVGSLLIVITMYDLRHKIIPNKQVYAFIAIAFVSLFWNHGMVVLPSLSAVLAGPFLAAPFFLLWFFSQGRAMGFGDVKLALGIGWLMGNAASLTVFVLSFWIGAIVGLFLIALSGRHRMKSQVPFAPFFILALFIVFIWNIDISSFFSLW